MRVQYRVVSCTTEPVPMKADIGGRSVDVTAEGVTLDVQSIDGSMAHTFRFLRDEAGGAEKLQPGDLLTATLSLDPEEDD